MTEIEQKALALVNEVRAEYPLVSSEVASNLALCRTIEQHEAFRREVSEVVESLCNTVLSGHYGDRNEMRDMLRRRFIIPQPDPLVEALEEWINSRDLDDAASFRAALAARGLKIVEDK